jgi:hypothetical protein
MHLTGVVGQMLTGVVDGATLSVPYDDYLHSWVVTPDFATTGGGDWHSCEKHYGISHWGSADPDPLRKLAFAILKGSGSFWLAAYGTKQKLCLTRDEAHTWIKDNVPYGHWRWEDKGSSYVYGPGLMTEIRF